MKEISKELMKVLKDNLVEGIEVIKKEYPELTKEIIAFSFIGNAIWVIIDFAMASLCVVLGFYFHHLAVKTVLLRDTYTNNYAEVTTASYWWIAVVGMVILTVCFIPSCWSNIENIIELKIAPRKFLLEYFKDNVLSK